MFSIIRTSVKCLSPTTMRSITTISSVRFQQEQSKPAKEYRFTMSNGKNNVLTDEQRDFYEENGYIVIKKLISDADLDLYEERFRDLATGKVKPSPMLTLQKELNIKKLKKELDETTLYKVQDLFADDVLFKYCNHPAILDYVEAFTGSPDIIAIHSMLINKPPDTGKLSSRHPMHQDLHYFPLRPADRIVATWTAMQVINKDNGCLSAIPGTHCGEHLEHNYPDWEGGVNRLYYGIKDLPEKDLDRRIHLEMERGDCAFFHPLLIHGSGVNRTSGFRRAISCHFASSRFCHYVDVEDTIQKELAAEILEVFQRKYRNFGASEEEIAAVDYKKLWKIRSRSTRGIVYPQCL